MVTVKECIFSNYILESTAIIVNLGNNLTVDQSISSRIILHPMINWHLILVEQQYITEYGNLNIINSNFSNNEITCTNNFNGGAIYISGSIITISSCRFNGNVASGNGGAIFVLREPFIMNITNSSFINNTVISSSGLGGAIFGCGVNITNSIFIDNSAGSTNGYGGAIYICDGKANVSGSYFSNNRAGDSGGAITINETMNILVSNTTFTKLIIQQVLEVVGQSTLVEVKAIMVNYLLTFHC